MNDEMHSWGPGGIFGQSAADAIEVLDEMDDGPHPDGNGGFREKPGVMNRLGAEDAIAWRRDQKARRNSMLLFERFIDELPDLRDKFLDSLGPDGLRGKIRERVMNRLVSPYMSTRPATVRAALGAHLREASFEATAEIFRRAYFRDVRRAQAAVRLGAFEPHQWAYDRAQQALEAPSTVAKTIMARAEALAARVKHVANAISEPLKEPEPEATKVEEPVPEEEYDESLI